MSYVPLRPRGVNTILAKRLECMAFGTGKECSVTGGSGLVY